MRVLQILWEEKYTDYEYMVMEKNNIKFSSKKDLIKEYIFHLNELKSLHAALSMKEKYFYISNN